MHTKVNISEFCLHFSGTLRPDLIESASAYASSNADPIKVHHNDTELVRELRTQVRPEYPYVPAYYYLYRDILMLKYLLKADSIDL